MRGAHASTPANLFVTWMLITYWDNKFCLDISVLFRAKRMGDAREYINKAI